MPNPTDSQSTTTNNNYISNSTTTSSTSTPNNCNQPRSITCLSAEELVFLSSSVAIALTKNKTIKEVETMINIVNLVQDNLIGILAQRGICNGSLNEFLTE